VKYEEEDDDGEEGEGKDKGDMLEGHEEDKYGLILPNPPPHSQPPTHRHKGQAQPSHRDNKG